MPRPRSTEREAWVALRLQSFVHRSSRDARPIAVARTAHGLDVGTAERCVDLPTEVADIDLDDVEIALEVLVPDVLHEVCLAADLTAVPNEVVQQGEFARGQR